MESDDQENLKKEILSLKDENQKLREKLQEYGYIFYDENQKLTSEEKIKIFQSYFRGRTDIYANRYISKLTGRKGYSFACENRFNRQNCAITLRTGSCNKCSYRNPSALTEDTIKVHFTKRNNQNPIAIYPMLSDNTCYFLAFDFDDDYWFESMLSLCRICTSKRIHPLMERSQSGNGGHLWIFFDNRILASKARKLGFLLLDEAMKSNPHIRFDSFDRMFPSQDYLSSAENIGNCIALPLQFDAYRNGNSAFINEYGAVYDHPIEMLASIPKVNEDQIDSILFGFNGIDFFFTEQNQIAMQVDQGNQYTREFEAVCDARIHINKDHLNALTIRNLRRIGSMPNPEYYECEKMHRYINRETTPLILSEVEETQNEIILPKGTKENIDKVFAGCQIKWVMNTSKGELLSLEFLGELRRDQMTAVSTALNEPMGIIESPTGSGKTVIGLYIVSKLCVSTLIIVPKLELVDNWKQQATKFLSIPIPKKKKDSYIGEYSGKRKQLKYHFDIAMINSLTNYDNLDELFSHYGLVIIDECHHVASEMFRKVLRHCSSNNIYSFSATPKRQDKLDRIMYMYCGQILYQASQNTKLSLLNFKKTLVKQNTTFRPTPSAKNYAEIINEMVMNERRNYQIFQDIARAAKEHRHILVLSERVQHLDVLYHMLHYIGPNCYVLQGDMKTKDRREMIAELRSLQDGFILLATGSLIGEGFDLPSLDTLFLTVPIRWQGRLDQYIGRIHRNYDGKNEVKVYDYVDFNCQMFQSMFAARLKEYYSNNYHLQEETESVIVNNQVFTAENYLTKLKDDISHATKSIYISTSYISLKLYKSLMKVFDEAQRHGTVICIETNSHQKDLQEISEFISGLDIAVNISDSAKQVIVIDQNVVWYGTAAILSIQKKEEYQIRLVNKKLAEEIYEK